MQKSEKSYKINITNPKYCLVTADTAEGTTYGTVKDFGEAQKIDLTPSIATGSLYGNGAMCDSASKLTAIAVAFDVTKIPVETQQDIFNHTVTDGVVQEKAGTMANYIALGYEVEQSSGKSEFVWLLKGRPKPMNESVTQSEGNITYSTDKMEIEFVRRQSDGMLRYFADLSNPEFTQEQADNWFQNGPSEPVAQQSDTQATE